MSVVCVTTGAHMNHVLNHVLKYEGHIELVSHLTGPERATHPLTRELTLNPTGPTFHRRTALPHTLGKCGPNPHHGIWRAGSTLHPRGVNSVVNTDQLNSYPGTHPGLWVGTPQHLPYLRPAGVHEETDPAEP